MIIIDILNPENNEIEERQQPKSVPREMTIAEIERMLPQTELQIVLVETEPNYRL